MLAGSDQAEDKSSPTLIVRHISLSQLEALHAGTAGDGHGTQLSEDSSAISAEGELWPNVSANETPAALG